MKRFQNATLKRMTCAAIALTMVATLTITNAPNAFAEDATPTTIEQPQGDETVPPTSETVPPVGETVPPVEETVPPTSETTPATQGIAPTSGLVRTLVNHTVTNEADLRTAIAANETAGGGQTIEVTSNIKLTDTINITKDVTIRGTSKDVVLSLSSGMVALSTASNPNRKPHFYNVTGATLNLENLTVLGHGLKPSATEARTYGGGVFINNSNFNAKDVDFKNIYGIYASTYKDKRSASIISNGNSNVVLSGNTTVTGSDMAIYLQGPLPNTSNLTLNDNVELYGNCLGIAAKDTTITLNATNSASSNIKIHNNKILEGSTSFGVDDKAFNPIDDARVLVNATGGILSDGNKDITLNTGVEIYDNSSFFGGVGICVINYLNDTTNFTKLVLNGNAKVYNNHSYATTGAGIRMSIASNTQDANGVYIASLLQHKLIMNDTSSVYGNTSSENGAGVLVNGTITVSDIGQIHGNKVVYPDASLLNQAKIDFLISHTNISEGEEKSQDIYGSTYGGGKINIGDVLCETVGNTLTVIEGNLTIPSGETVNNNIINKGDGTVTIDGTVTGVVINEGNGTAVLGATGSVGSMTITDDNGYTVPAGTTILGNIINNGTGTVTVAEGGKVDGDITSKGDVVVNGEVTGNVTSEGIITIAEGAIVGGNVKIGTGEVYVAGDVLKDKDGNVILNTDDSDKIATGGEPVLGSDGKQIIIVDETSESTITIGGEVKGDVQGGVGAIVIGTDGAANVGGEVTGNGNITVDENATVGGVVSKGEETTTVIINGEVVVNEKEDGTSTTGGVAVEGNATIEVGETGKIEGTIITTEGNTNVITLTPGAVVGNIDNQGNGAITIPEGVVIGAVDESGNPVAPTIDEETGKPTTGNITNGGSGNVEVGGTVTGNIENNGSGAVTVTETGKVDGTIIAGENSTGKIEIQPGAEVGSVENNATGTPVVEVVIGGTVTGDVTNNGTGTVTVQPGGEVSGSIITGENSTGTVTIEKGDGTIPGAIVGGVDNSGSGEVTIGGTVIENVDNKGDGKVILTEDGKVEGNVNNSGNGNVAIEGEVTGNVNNTGETGLINVDGGTVGGAITGGVNNLPGAGIIIDNGGTVTEGVINNGGGKVDVIDGTVNGGVVNNGTGTVTVNPDGTVNGGVVNNGGGTIDVEAGGTVTGGITNNGDNGTVTVDRDGNVTGEILNNSNSDKVSVGGQQITKPNTQAPTTPTTPTTPTPTPGTTTTTSGGKADKIDAVTGNTNNTTTTTTNNTTTVTDGNGNSATINEPVSIVDAQAPLGTPVGTTFATDADGNTVVLNADGTPLGTTATAPSEFTTWDDLQNDLVALGSLGDKNAKDANVLGAGVEKGNPKTGDNSNSAAYVSIIAMLGVAAFGMRKVALKSK